MKAKNTLGETNKMESQRVQRVELKVLKGGFVVGSLVALFFAIGLAVPAFSSTAESMEDAGMQTDAFVIGQLYGGGIIFWIDDSGQHGLIAAESDQGYNWWGDRNYFLTG